MIFKSPPHPRFKQLGLLGRAPVATSNPETPASPLAAVPAAMRAAGTRPRRQHSALEARILFDAAGVAAADHQLDDTAHQQAEAQRVASEQARVAEQASQIAERFSAAPQGDMPAGGNTVVIIDSRVPNYQDLLQGLDANTTVRIVGPEEDGLKVISETLGSTGNVGSLQIVSHGQPGAMALGTSVLDSRTLQDEATMSQLQGWQSGMTQNADILLLGCDVAEGARGQAFVQRLADLTQADVSASVDDTGAASRGGNWTLEFTVGERDSRIAFSQAALDSYRELLPAGPTTTLTLPAETLIGATNQTGSVTFDNTGTSIGYAPYVAVAFDSSRSPDPTSNVGEGITYTAGSGSYLGTPLADTAVLTFDAAGNASSPAVLDPATGLPLVFTAASFGMGAGDTLVIYQLPFGSFTPDNPPARIDFRYNVGPNADSANSVAQGGEGGPGLGISSRGFFLLGETPQAETGATDPIVFQGAATVAATNPIWYRTAYINSSREAEQVPGANDKQYFIAELQLAAGQTVLSNNGVINPTNPGATTDRFVSRMTIPNNINFDPATDVTLNYNASSTVASPNDTPVTGAQIFVVDRATGIPAGQPGGPVRDPVLGTWSSAGGVELVAISPAGTSFTGGVLGLELNYFIPDTVINPATGADVPQQFDARHTGAVRFADSDDPQNATFNIDPAPVVIEYETIQIQKVVTGDTPNTLDTANPAGVRSGDVLTYTLTVQVGDFYGIRNAVVTDVLPDGIEFNVGSMRVTGVNVNGQTISSPIGVTPTVTGVGTVDIQADESAAAIDVDPGTPGVQVGNGGRQVLQFNLSNAISGATGGNTAVNGAQAGDLLGDAFGTAAGQGLTVITITYTGTVRDTYRVAANGNPTAPTGSQILENDVLRNDVRVSGTLLRDNDAGPGAAIASTGVINADDSTAVVTVKDGRLDLEVFAVNGVLVTNASVPKDPAGRPIISAGDNVTYRLRYNLSQGDFNNLRLEGYLPDPIFNASDPDQDGTPNGYTGVTPANAAELTTGGGTAASNWAQAGTYLLGPTHNQGDVALGTPVVTSTSTTAGNSVAFSLPISSSRPANPANERVDFLFTVRASDRPYADNLLLTAQGRETGERSVNGGVTEPTPLPDDRIVQIVRAEPRLVVSHGVVATAAGQGGVISGNTGLGTVGAAGTAGQPFSGVITNAGQINGNVTNVDGADTLRMGFAIENSGTSNAFDVRTTAITPPPGYRFASNTTNATDGGNNFQVRTGAGTLLVAGVDYTVTTVGGQAVIELIDGANTGKLGRGKNPDGSAVTNGSNVVVITYDIVADNGTATQAVAADNSTSLLAVDSYSSRNGGTDFTTTINAATGGQVRDDALLEIARPVVDIRWQNDSTDGDKTTTNDDSNQIHTAGPDLVIGEGAYFDLKITLPEGVTNGLFADINLPPGLRLDTTYNSGAGYEVIGLATGTNGQLAANFNGGGSNPAAATNITGIGGTLGTPGVGARVSLGTISNGADNIAGNNSFLVRVRVVVDNSASNQQGVQLTTTSDSVFTDPDGVTGVEGPQQRDIPDTTTANDPTINIVEPTVTTVKTVAIVDVDAATPGDQPGTEADENDIVEYTITLTNTSGVRAFDLSLTDTFPPQLLNNGTLAVVGVSSSNALRSGSVTALDGTDFSLNSGTRLLTFNTGRSYDLNPGGTITIRIRGTVNDSAAALTSFNNDAETRWTSLDRSTANGNNNGAGERGGATGLLAGSGVSTGNGTTSGTGADQAVSTSLNDYRTASRAVVPVVALQPVLSHIGGLADTSANPADTRAAQDVAVGEVTRFRMVTRVPAGQIANFSLQPTLPPGYEYLGNARVALVSDSGMTSSVLSGAGLQADDDTNPAIYGNIQGDLTSATYSGAGADPRGTAAPTFAIANGGTAAAPVFNLGTLDNNDNDTDFEYVVIEFNAVATNSLANQSGANLGPVVFDVRTGATTIGTSNTVTDRVVEPNISNLDKRIIDIPAGTQDSTTPGSYTVTVQNSFTSNGGTAAYDTQFRDSMPGGTAASNIQISLDGGATFTTLAAFANPALGRSGTVSGGVVDINFGDVPVGTNVVVRYDTVVPSTGATQAASALTNAQVVFSSIPDIAATSIGATGFAGSTIPGADGAANGERNGALVAQTTGPANDIANAALLNNYRNTDPAGYGTISGVLWDDTDNPNGVVDAGESLLAGVTVTLTWGGADGNLATTADNRTITTITNASGAYNFGALPQGGYQITVPGTTPKTDGTAATDPDTLAIRVDADSASPVGTINSTVAEAATVVVGTNSITGRNFGYVQPNDPPQNSFGGSPTFPTVATPQVVNEDGSLPFNTAGNRLTIADPDGARGDGLLQTTLTLPSSGAGTLAVTNGGGGATVTGSGGQTVTIVGTQADINTALATLVYSPAANFNGDTTITMVTNDRGQGGDANGNLTPREPGGTASPDALIDTDTIFIRVNPVNDAPVASGSATLPATVEDTANPPGTAISTLFGPNFSDAADTVPGGSSANTLAGIAITANPAAAAQGVWQYSPDGTTWTAVPAGLSDTNALILPASYQLRFLPDADYNSSAASPAPALTTRLVDSSGGAITAPATGQNVATNGGTTPYSAGVVVLNTAVTPINDAPLFTSTADTLLGTANEDAPSTPVTIATAFPGYSDPADLGEANGIDSRVGVVIVGNAANPLTEGSWQYFDGTAWQSIPATVSDTTAIYLPDGTQLRFNPVANYNGTPGQLTARLVENDQTATPDLPANGTGTAFFGGANTPATIRTGIDLPAAGGVGGTSRISANTRDVGITIAPLNDAPVASGSATLPATVEDTANPPGTAISTLFGPNFSDAADTVPGGSSANTLAGIAITANPAAAAQGVWQYSPDGTTWTAVPAGLSDTNALILPASYQLRFLPDADYNSSAASPAPALTTRLVDSSGGAITAPATGQNVATNGGTTPYSAGVVVLNTAVTPINDAPLFTSTADTLLGTANEDAPSTPVTIATAFPGYSDPADLGEANGIDSRVGVVIVGNAANPLTEGSWQYFDGTAWQSIPATVSDTTAIYLPDGTQLRFNPVANYNGTPGQLTARLVENDQTATPDLPANGTGTAFFGGANTPATIRTGIDLPAAGGVGGTSRISANTRDVGITIAPLNDAPAFTSTTPTQLPAFNEDAPSASATVATAFPGYGDAIDSAQPNGGDNRLGVVLTGNAATPAQGNWQYSPDGGTTWVDVPRTLSDNNALYLPDSTPIRFNPAPNFNGTPGNLRARVVEDDQTATPDLPANGTGTAFFGGANTSATIRGGIDLVAAGGVGGNSRISSNQREVGITVTPVNDPPDVTVPTNVLPAEDRPITFTGPNSISVSDPADFPAGDGPVVTVTITPTANGRPFITALTPGVTAGPGSPVGSVPPGGGTPIVLTGTLADINRTLQNLQYVSAPFYNGPDSFTVQINDNANGGPGPLQDIATVQINNTPLNDRPVVNGPVAPDFQPLLPGNNTPGRSVQDMFGPRFTDPRDAPVTNTGDSFAGIAIISTPPASQGTYQYSTDGGQTWIAIAPGTTAANAVVLAPDAQIRFVSNPAFVGETTPLQAVLIETDQQGGRGDLLGRPGVPLDTPGSGVPVSGTIIDLSRLEANEAATTTNGIGRSRFSSLANPMTIGVRIDPPVVEAPPLPALPIAALLTPLPPVLDLANAGSSSEFVGNTVRQVQAQAAAAEEASDALFASNLGNSGLQPNWIAPAGIPGADPLNTLPAAEPRPAAPPAPPARAPAERGKAADVDCARPRVVAKPRPPGEVARPAPRFPPGSEAAKRFSEQLKRARARARC
jgi:fimbrial isopeptide formation D2 family protein